MGTSNYHIQDASKAYSIDIEHEFDLSDLELNTRSELSEMCDNKNYNYDECDERPSSELRSFPARTICKIKSEDFHISDLCFNLEFHIIIRNGYYAGANLDFEEWINPNNSEEFETLDNLLNDISSYPEDYTIDKKDIESVQNELKIWYKKISEEMRTNIEKIFSDLSTPLNVICRFGNGETIYAVK